MSEWTATGLDGVMRTHVPTFADTRGAFTELWRASLTRGVTDETFVQSNRSRSAQRVLRGMHFHRRQADLWVVSSGRALVAACDLRGVGEGGGSPTTETHELATGDCIFLPRLVAHGFLAVEPIELIYFVTNEYDGSDELGFAWDDPEVGIEWPIEDPILSDRDTQNPPLRTALSLEPTPR
jgi:dTDP-4-dehydrorhamnose 3,5-epimerase